MQQGKARPGHLERLCREPELLAEFYQKLGFEETVWQGRNHCWLKLGELELLLRRGEPADAAANWPGQRLGLVLYTDDLPGLLNRLKAEGIEPIARDGDCPLLQDPEGQWVQLVDPASHS